MFLASRNEACLVTLRLEIEHVRLEGSLTSTASSLPSVLNDGRISKAQSKRARTMKMEFSACKKSVIQHKDLQSAVGDIGSRRAT